MFAQETLDRWHGIARMPGKARHIGKQQQLCRVQFTAMRKHAVATPTKGLLIRLLELALLGQCLPVFSRATCDGW